MWYFMLYLSPYGAGDCCRDLKEYNGKLRKEQRPNQQFSEPVVRTTKTFRPDESPTQKLKSDQCAPGRFVWTTEIFRPDDGTFVRTTRKFPQDDECAKMCQKVSAFLDTSSGRRQTFVRTTLSSSKPDLFVSSGRRILSSGRRDSKFEKMDRTAAGNKG